MHKKLSTCAQSHNYKFIWINIKIMYILYVLCIFIQKLSTYPHFDYKLSTVKFCKLYLERFEICKFYCHNVYNWLKMSSLCTDIAFFCIYIWHQTNELLDIILVELIVWYNNLNSPQYIKKLTLSVSFLHFLFFWFFQKSLF